MTWGGAWSGDWPGSWAGAEGGGGGPTYADAACVITAGGALVGSLDSIIRVPAPGFFNEASGLMLGAPPAPPKRRRLRQPAPRQPVYADAFVLMSNAARMVAAIDSTRRWPPVTLTRSAPVLARSPRVPVLRSTPALVRSHELELVP